MKIEVSKMTRFVTLRLEPHLPAMAGHERLELFQRHDLAKRGVHRLGSGLDTKHAGCLVGQLGIQPERRNRQGHPLSSFVYIQYR